MICNATLAAASIKETHPHHNAVGILDRLSYEALSLDNLFELIERIENGELDNVDDPETVRNVKELVVFLARTGSSKLTPQEKEELENDIQELLREEDDYYWNLSGFGDSEGFYIIPTILYPYQYKYSHCGWLKKKFNQVVHFIENHKKAILIGVAVAAVVTGVGIAVASAGAAGTQALGVGMSAAAGAADAHQEEKKQRKREEQERKRQEERRREEQRQRQAQANYINKAGQVRFQEDVAYEEEQLAYENSLKEIDYGTPTSNDSDSFYSAAPSIEESHEGYNEAYHEKFSPKRLSPKPRNAASNDQTSF
ncbi:MAG: hypothetical protein AAF443_00375 [Chlamydiota bacterium]